MITDSFESYLFWYFTYVYISLTYRNQTMNLSSRHYRNSYLLEQEEFEDTKGVIRIRISKKNRVNLSSNDLQVPFWLLFLLFLYLSVWSLLAENGLCYFGLLYVVHIYVLTFHFQNVKHIFLSMCDVKVSLTFTSLSLVLFWQLFYLFCSSIVVNTVIVTAGNFEP